MSNTSKDSERWPFTVKVAVVVIKEDDYNTTIVRPISQQDDLTHMKKVHTTPELTLLSGKAPYMPPSTQTRPTVTELGYAML